MTGWKWDCAFIATIQVHVTSLVNDSSLQKQKSDKVVLNLQYVHNFPCSISLVFTFLSLLFFVLFSCLLSPPFLLVLPLIRRWGWGWARDASGSEAAATLWHSTEGEGHSHAGGPRFLRFQPHQQVRRDCSSLSLYLHLDFLLFLASTYSWDYKIIHLLCLSTPPFLRVCHSVL